MKFYLAAVSMILLWASSFVAIRYTLHAYHPGSLALLRYLVASLIMFIVSFKFKRKVRMSRKQYGISILCGFLGIGLYNIMLNYGELSVSAAIASFTISQVPIVMILFGLCYFGEKLSAKIALGILLSFFGVALIAYGRQTGIIHFDMGLLYVIVAVFCAAFYSILQKPLLKVAHPIQLVCYAIWGGTAFLLFYLPQLWIDIQHAPWLSTLIVIYLGIFPAALAYILWSYLLSTGTMISSAGVLYIIPLATMLLGWLFLGELPATVGIFGGCVALFGAYLVSSKPTQ